MRSLSERLLKAFPLTPNEATEGDRGARLLPPTKYGRCPKHGGALFLHEYRTGSKAGRKYVQLGGCELGAAWLLRRDGRATEAVPFVEGARWARAAAVLV